MPQRLTVAGEATLRSWTSNIMWRVVGNLMRSEFAKHKVLLSSSTCFVQVSLVRARFDISTVAFALFCVWCAGASGVKKDYTTPVVAPNYLTRVSLVLAML